MVENEFKVMLTKEQYEKIFSLFKYDKIIEQVNYYYDTDNLKLSELHITCRVREIKGEFFLQIKLPNGAEHSRIELERKLTSLPEKISSEELDSLSGKTDLPDVKLLGKLSTNRAVKHFDGCELDLDRSGYFGKTDYELEVEFTDETAARELLKKIRAETGIVSSSDVCPGKVRRFLEEFKKEK